MAAFSAASAACNAAAAGTGPFATRVIRPAPSRAWRRKPRWSRTAAPGRAARRTSRGLARVGPRGTRRVLGQAGGGRGGPADPLVPPRLVVLLVVAPRLVYRSQLPSDLLPVRPTAARHLVGADVDRPLGPGALDPAMRARMLEREPLRGQVIGVADVDDRVPVRLGVRFWLVGDRVDSRPGRRRPAGQQPGPLERVSGQRSEPDHPAASSSSLIAFTGALLPQHVPKLTSGI